MKLTKDDLSVQTEVRVHLDVWLKRYEWEEILENQKKASKVDEYQKCKQYWYDKVEKIKELSEILCEEYDCGKKVKEVLDTIHSMEAMKNG